MLECRALRFFYGKGKLFLFWQKLGEDKTKYGLSIFYVPETVVSILFEFSPLILSGPLHRLSVPILQKRKLKLRGVNLLKVTKSARGRAEVWTRAIQF